MGNRIEDICALIPCYNGVPVIKGIIGVLKDKGLEVVVVDDGSTDDTLQVSREAGAIVLRNAVNRGKGVALVKGFKYVVEKGYKAVIILDSDGQHDPEEIDGFIDCFREKNSGLVIGTRMHDPKGMPMIRRLTNMYLSHLLSKITGVKVTDSQSGYRLIKTGLLKDMELTSRHFEIESEIFLEACRLNARVDEVPIKTIYRSKLISMINPIIDTLRFVRFITTWKKKED